MIVWTGREKARWAEETMTRKKAWEGRLGGGIDPLFETFNSSLAVDRRLLLPELEQDRAWAHALGRAGIYGKAELARVMRALETMEAEARAGAFPFRESDEDVHMAVERRLTELAGSPGEKLQTGRSRNDQVGTSLRLHLRREGSRVLGELRELQQRILQRTADEVATPMPGLTHLQPAQVLSLGHYLLAWFWALDRDAARIREALARTDRMPLGSGALAGTTLKLDRDELAEELGFSAVTENSLDAVGDRDFVAELSFALAQLLVHLSRWAEDWIGWCSPAYGFLELPDRLSTGSSLMPQKKNPDGLELIRGKAAGAIGQVTAALALQKGLPSSYNKDLQEDKEGLFNLISTAVACVEVFAKIVAGCRFDRDRMRGALTDDLYATDLADYLVAKGVPFRRAHEIVGQLVRESLVRQVPLSKLPIESYQTASHHFGADVSRLFQPRASFARREVEGGTGIEHVATQLESARARLAGKPLPAIPGPRGRKRSA